MGSESQGVLERKALRAAVNGGTASVKLSDEVALHACEAAWTQVDAGCAVDISTTFYKRGAASASFVIGAAAAQGIQARVAPATDNTDISGGTHLCCNARVTAALAADDARLGFDNTASAGGTQRYVSVPALATPDQWYGLCLPLVGLMSAAELAALSSVSTLILYLENADWEGTLYLDNLRIVTIETSGDAGITMPDAHTVGQVNGDTDVVNFFLLPFRSQRVTTNRLPMDITFVPFNAAGEGAPWLASDRAQGYLYRSEGETISDIARNWTAVGLKRADDLASGEYLHLEVA